MKYMLIINDEELIANGDELGFDEVKDEVEELLRSGYYYVESMEYLAD